jgi:pyridoxamine 5'-phosphate oxidase
MSNLPPTQAGPLDYSDASVVPQALPDPLPPAPWPIFKVWWDWAHSRKQQPNPNAMSLATIEPDGTPSARIVLCKEMDLERGYLVFHTNYDGRKGRALAANPRAALIFHWDHQDVQVRVEGPVTRSPEAESEAYFKTRPWISRVGAWTSEQSSPVASRREMVERLDATLRRFGVDPAHQPAPDAAMSIPRPPNWGGFRVWAERVELWVGGVGRLHDRARWSRTLEPGPDGYQAAGAWSSTRLQP